MQELKILTGIFVLGCVGVVVSFSMGMYTGYQNHKAEVNPAPISIPTPAM